MSAAAAALAHAPTHTARELSKFAVQQGAFELDSATPHTILHPTPSHLQVQQGAFELKFAGVDAFAKGLDALVGLPSPQATF